MAAWTVDELAELLADTLAEKWAAWMVGWTVYLALK